MPMSARPGPGNLYASLRNPKQGDWLPYAPLQHRAFRAVSGAAYLGKTRRP